MNENVPNDGNDDGKKIIRIKVCFENNVKRQMWYELEVAQITTKKIYNKISKNQSVSKQVQQWTSVSNDIASHSKYRK